MITIDIGNFLGFCDMNGVDAVQGEKVQELENYISECNKSHNAGEDLVPDAIYDRLMEILRQVNPESELCKYIWEDSVDEFDDNTDSIIQKNPMYSIQTVKSYDCDEIKAYVDRLPVDFTFTAHVSVKLNGHGIRLVYKDGDFFQARTRARSSAGRDITPQLKAILEEVGLLHIPELEGTDLCEVRGELVLPFCNLAEARKHNPDIKSAFSAVASMSRDSATKDEWKLLKFVAYEFLAEGNSFSSKDSEYSFLEEDCGFEVPLNWLIDDLSKDTLIEDIKGIVSDCEEEVKPDSDGNNGYDYYTDGLVFTINNTDDFRRLGDDGSHYKYGNMALKVGYWKQDMYSGYVQTIAWMKGKTKLTPVAIIAEDLDAITFNDGEEHKYVTSLKDIENFNDLGVITASGNRVRRVPLYEPNNILALDAYKDSVIYFRYGGEAGVVPCYPDGTPLLEGRAKQIISNELPNGFVDDSAEFDDGQEWVEW